MQTCPWDAAQYLIFSDNVPPLLYYSHGIAIVSALIFGISILLMAKRILSAKLFFIITILFSLWILLDLFLWAQNNPSNVMFFWSLIIPVEILIYLFSIYFIDVFNENKDISSKKKIFLIALFLPIIITLPTSLNLVGIDLNSCVAIEGIMTKYYIYFIELLSIILISIYSIRLYLKSIDLKEKKQIVLSTAGILFFLLAFSSGNIIGSFSEKWEYSQIGLFAMPIFIGILSYLVVKYNSFNVKLIATQALVWALAILIGAQFFFIKVTSNFILNGITFIGIIIFGQILIKSVKREIEQREKLEVLTNELYEANVKLQSLDKLKTEFVSLASHQLRSPLTAIKGYTSMLLENDYGEINPKALEIIERVRESSNNLTMVVEDLLNVAKIEQGGMKYEMDKVDFGDLTRDTARDLSIVAEKKGLKLTYDIPEDIKYFVSGDKEKLRQILINLIDNSMKYTKEGHIEVNLNIKDGKILLSIKDTGVGISKEVIGTLFQKFSRGDGAKQNSTGSGLGLYLVKEIIEAHHGRVWIESEGEGKGSTFFVEMGEAV